MKKFTRAFAPATVANVGCAFDVLGFAVNNPGDEVSLEYKNEKGIVITSIEGDDGKLPLDAEKNTASVALQAFLNHIGADFGFNMQIKKMMPLGSGMGSSAASAAAAIFAANFMLDFPCTKEELLPFAMESERMACGAAHADNAAPALFGGFVLIRSYTPLDIIQLPTPKDLYCSLVHPLLELKTSDSRRILKKEVALPIAIKQWGNIAGLVSGLFLSDYSLIGRSLEDFIFEPVRSFVIPAFDNIKRAALDAGALGCSIAGSGPSLFAFSNTKDTADQVAQAMQKAFKDQQIDSQIYVSLINSDGPRILESA